MNDYICDTSQVHRQSVKRTRQWTRQSFSGRLATTAEWVCNTPGGGINGEHMRMTLQEMDVVSDATTDLNLYPTYH
jgi:hypothetical protein